MRLVANTNRIIAALIKNSASRKILTSPEFQFLVPDFSLEEISRHKEEICKKSGLSAKSFDTLLGLLFSSIEIVPLSENLRILTLGRKDKYSVEKDVSLLSIKDGEKFVFFEVVEIK